MDGTQQYTNTSRKKIRVLLLVIKRHLKRTGGDNTLGTWAIHQVENTLSAVDKLHRFRKGQLTPVIRIVEGQYHLIGIDVDLVDEELQYVTPCFEFDKKLREGVYPPAGV